MPAAAPCTSPRSRSTRTGALLACAAAVLAGLSLCWAQPGGSAPAEPLRVLVSYADLGGTVRATLGFSRRAEYRLEETRGRLRVLLEEPVDRSSKIDRDLDGDVVRRLRVDETSRGGVVVFTLGKRYATFSSAELDDPFRIVLTFLPEGSSPPEPGEQEDPQPGQGSIPGPAVPPGAEPVIPPGSGSPLAEPSGPLRRVVLDPGHGGSEEGAVSRSGLKEKEIVLDIARRLRDRLAGDGYSVALTRDGDEAVDLESRTALANQAGADLFVSIHANASLRSAVHGAETYFLSYGASDEEAMSLARLENRSPAGPGAVRGDDIKAVLWEMAQAEHLASSSRLADIIQTELNGLGGTSDRGVKQAPFRVLVGAAMPAVLVEVGFVSNDAEEKRLASGDYREQVAAAMASAIDRFRQERLRASGYSAP
ncbi:MAG TPA: N-acetylmuramoyl-L-alanine amidase [Candidatus Polarisedimenticolia bacterium]|nr:N-acetylmuramoyl-L-alanine amidase [Candidatus Polarisedimenticolia bacterium]